MDFVVLKQQAKNKLKDNCGTVVIATLILLLLLVFSTATGFGIIFYGAIYLGGAIFFLNLCRYNHADIKDLFKGFNDFGNAFLLELVRTLIIILWLLVFIIPGIIKMFSWSLAYYIQKDNPDWNYKKVLDTSSQWMKGHKWELFLLELSFIGWILLSIITLGFALIYVVPYITATRAEYYEYIKSLNESVEVDK